MKQKILSVQKLYRQGQDSLAAAGITDAKTDAWILLEHITGINKMSYYANPDATVGENFCIQYMDGIEKRKERVPLQHITGTQEFMGYPFKVNNDVLIPRQDTETLVEEALQYMRDIHGPISVLDMCTGSGCIIISILKYLSEKRGVLAVYGTGVDISRQALGIARENAALLRVEAEFLESDLFDGLEGREGEYSLILSNPPYIRSDVIEKLEPEVRCHDPRLALDGKEDGLHFYRRIIKESVKFLASGGRLLLEIGFDQAEEVTALLKSNGYCEVHVKKDLSGLDRVVSGMYNKS